LPPANVKNPNDPVEEAIPFRYTFIPSVAPIATVEDSTYAVFADKEGIAKFRVLYTGLPVSIVMLVVPFNLY
jgi:hypothetical protein